jgi:GSH-dependent disulfide-bond oxidoreductase
MIDLYWVPTANGQRAAIMLEETGETYRVRPVDMMRGEHRSEHYLELNPLGKVPTIVDDETGLTVYGTLAIALYLADKRGMLLGETLPERAAVYHWAGIVASDLGPAFTGQYVFNVLAPEKLDFAIGYFDEQISRILGAVDAQLSRQPFLAGDRYTLADALAYPVAATSAQRLAEGLAPWTHIRRWAELVGQRPAVQRAMAIGAL